MDGTRQAKLCIDRFRVFCSPDTRFCQAFGVTSFLFVFLGSSIRLKKLSFRGIERSQTRTVVRECFKGDEVNQWKRPKFDLSPHQNPLTDLHKIGNRDYVLDGTRHAKFCSDRFWGFCSPNTWFCRAFGVTSMLVFWGFFNKATAYTPGRIFTQNTSNDVVLGKEVPFGGPDDYILYFHPWVSEKPPFPGPILTGPVSLRPKTALTWGCPNISYP